MRVVKKINNNVAICKDNNDQELIAIGKGIGFPKTPYILNDLSKIDMTFYRVSSQNLALLANIPTNVVTVCTKIVNFARTKISFSQNMIFSLADHITFAIERNNKGENFNFSFSYDIQHMYPREYQVGLEAVKIINHDLDTNLPQTEAVAIALHFINASEKPVKNLNSELNEKLLKLALNIIEKQFNFTIDQSTFTFTRFKIHFQYYLQRISDDKQLAGEISAQLIQEFKKTNHDIYQCTVDIILSVDQEMHSRTTDDEMFYLMIYINRLVSKLKRE